MDQPYNVFVNIYKLSNLICDRRYNNINKYK